jgi:hypothetical protein
MKHTPWPERTFTFDFPVTHFPFIIERLRGTPLQIADMVKGMNDEALSKKPGDKWSVKEHIGHLSDLEMLHEGRIDDFRNGLKLLRAADMTNQKTNEADHNKTSIKLLMDKFTKGRASFITRLEGFSEAELWHKALHPRLKMEMRPLDLAYFVAEHDDHHLVLMRKTIV